MRRPRVERPLAPDCTTHTLSTMRRSIVLLALALLVASCGDDDAAGDTTTLPPSTTTTTTTAATTAAPSTTAAPTTTRTTFEAPPATSPNPERGQFVGIWRWPDTHTRYIQLYEHGVIAVGAIVEDSLQLPSLGEWDVVDGVMTITSLQIGADTCADDAVGTYAIRLSGQNLVMDRIADACEGRATWLIGSDLDRRTWLPADASGP